MTDQIDPEDLAAPVDIEAVIAELGTRFDADEASIAERLLREYGGTIPDTQLVEEIGLAVAIHRKQKRP